MVEPISGSDNKRKCDSVADAINRLLHNLIIKCARGEGVRNFYAVGVIGYGNNVAPGFSGKLAGRELVPISEVANAPARVEEVDGYPRRAWTDASGRVLVEDYVVTGMAHGTPLRPGREAGESGKAGAHMLDVGLSSTDRIAAFFGIAPKPGARTERPHARPAVGPDLHSEPANDVQSVIEKALRAAGLMR